jgi:hypothetical protein
VFLCEPTVSEAKTFVLFVVSLIFYHEVHNGHHQGSQSDKFGLSLRNEALRWAENRE